MTTPLRYAPPAYAAADPAAIVREFPFATLLTATPDGIFATQTPILFERDGDDSVMVGHLARNNPHAGALQPGQNVLALFQGPHAYISAGWYVDLPTVPTWNYVSAQLRGTLEPLDDEASLLRILERTTEIVERDEAQRWTMDQAPEGRVAFLLPMIRGFRIRVRRIDGVTKLSQMHPQSDRLRVMDQLRRRADGNSVAIADWMAAFPSAV
jgi:transcriptional regulator